MLRLITIMAILFASHAHALTIPTGHVIGPDGQIYEGASPQQKALLLRLALETGKTSGVSGNSIFIIVNETITFIPIRDIAGREEEEQIEIITEAVTETITAKVITEKSTKVSTKETKVVKTEKATKAVELDIDGKAVGSNIQEDLTPVKSTPIVPKIKKDDIEEAEELAEEAAAAAAAVAEEVAEVVEEVVENVAGAPEVQEAIAEAVNEVLNDELEDAIAEVVEKEVTNIVKNDELEDPIEQLANPEANEGDSGPLNDPLEGPTD